MNWTPLQEAIFQAEALGGASLSIHARAGTGKTTTGVETLRRSRAPSILALAFNKSIQLELEQRLGTKAEARTFNGLGHRAWAKAIRKPKLKLNQRKSFEVLSKLSLPPGTSFSEVLSLVSAAKAAGLVPSGTMGRSLVPDTAETWSDLCDLYDIDLTDDGVALAKQVLLKSIPLAYQGEIDFADQLYMPVCFSAPFQQYPLVMVDEAQDLSPIQHEMVRRSSLRILSFGDPFQAIYGWRGAHSSSMEELEKLFQAQILPLNETFRCGKAIVSEANRIVQDFFPGPGNSPGTVARFHQWTLQSLKRPAAVLCRNNAPLIGLAFLLLQAKIPFTIRGRDIGAGLVKLVENLEQGQVLFQKQFLGKLKAWREAELLKKPSRAAVIKDKTDALATLAVGCPDSRQLKNLLKAFFSEEISSLTLSTIHKAKGLEWPTVYILNSFLIPSKHATQDWQLQQENNLLYVAITRAKEELFYINGGDLV